MWWCSPCSEVSALSLTGCGTLSRDHHTSLRQCGTAKPEAIDLAHWVRRRTTASLQPHHSWPRRPAERKEHQPTSAHPFLTLKSEHKGVRTAARSLCAMWSADRYCAQRVRLAQSGDQHASHGRSGANRTFPADPLIPRWASAGDPSVSAIACNISRFFADRRHFNTRATP